MFWSLDMVQTVSCEVGSRLTLHGLRSPLRVVVCQIPYPVTLHSASSAIRYSPPDWQFVESSLWAILGRTGCRFEPIAEKHIQTNHSLHSRPGLCTVAELRHTPEGEYSPQFALSPKLRIELRMYQNCAKNCECTKTAHRIANVPKLHTFYLCTTTGVVLF